MSTSLANIINGYQFNWEFEKKDFEGILTAQYIDSLYKKFIDKKLSDNYTPGDLNEILPLIKRFELNKKIYTHYNYSWISSDKVEIATDLYFQLLILLLLAYDYSRDLRFLNTSLKINDYIKSSKHDLASSIDSYIYQRLEVLYVK